MPTLIDAPVRVAAAGAPPKTIDEFVGRASSGAAVRFRRTFLDAYVGIARWHQRHGDEAIATRTLAGRRRLGVTASTATCNTPVQGSAADGLKIALRLLFDLVATQPRGSTWSRCVPGWRAALRPGRHRRGPDE